MPHLRGRRSSLGALHEQLDTAHVAGGGEDHEWSDAAVGGGGDVGVLLEEESEELGTAGLRDER